MVNYDSPMSLDLSVSVFKYGTGQMFCLHVHCFYLCESFMSLLKLQNYHSFVNINNLLMLFTY